jgi:hypothetical protein
MARDPATGLPVNNTGVAGPGAEAGGITGPAGAPLPNSDKWDTDGYAKPGYIAQKPTKTAPPGWNNEKWNNPNHQTPKYVVGRILSQFQPRTENVEAARAEIDKAFPGTRRVSNGDLDIPGIGIVDVLTKADIGGKAWHFGVGDGGKGAKGGGKGVDTSGIQSAADAARGYAEGGDIAGGSDIAKILARLGQLSGSNVRQAVRRSVEREYLQPHGRSETSDLDPQACSSQACRCRSPRCAQACRRAWVPRWRHVLIHVRRAPRRDHVQQRHRTQRAWDDSEHVPRSVAQATEHQCG